MYIAESAFGDSLGGLVGLRIVLIVCGVLLVPLVGLVLQLAGFHVMLGESNSFTNYKPVILFHYA